MDPYIDIAKLMSVRLLQFMQSVSNTSRIGFGTFVDKETIPFHFNQRGKKDFPGVSRAFKNIRSLTGNKNVVATSVRNFTTGTNDDQPEGVLEAIVQAVTCTDSIREFLVKNVSMDLFYYFNSFDRLESSVQLLSHARSDD